MLRPILLNVFCNDLDDGAGHTLSRFVGVTKIGESVGTPAGCAAIQWHVERLEILAARIS